MTDRILDQRTADWRIDWTSARTRMRIVVFAVCTGAATVAGSLLGLFPEALLHRVLTERGIAMGDGMAVMLAGGFVQLICVLLALYCLARMIRWATSARAAIDGLDVTAMHESLRRIGREGFLFPLFGAIAVVSQIIIELGEDPVMEWIVGDDTAFMAVSRFPSAMFLIFAAASLTMDLRRFLASRD